MLCNHRVVARARRAGRVAGAVLAFQDVTDRVKEQEDVRRQPLRIPELRAGKMLISERPIRRKDGSVRVAEVSAKLLPDGRVQAIARDITEQKRDTEAQCLLAKASRVLSSSLDYPTTLSRVAHLAVPALADRCFVYVFDEAVLHRTEVAYSDPADRDVARRLAESPTPTLDAICKALPQLCAGESILLERVSPEILKAIARSPEHLHAIRAIGAQSAMVVPMEVRGRVLGLINIISTRAASPRSCSPTSFGCSSGGIWRGAGQPASGSAWPWSESWSRSMGEA